MKRIALQVNTVNCYHSKESGRDYNLKICEELGRGASCITYLAEEISTGLRYVLKECFPIYNAGRNDSGGISWENDTVKENCEAKIRKAFEVQKTLQLNETVNANAHLTDGLLEANNTLYLLIDPRNAETYDKVKDGSIQDTLKTAKAIAIAVGAQHRLGYLNLDIKPQNIMVYPQTREMVMLLDFDSLVEKASVSSSETISYSIRYAAPEQLQGSKRKICEATDVYAIGAIVFERIFGRVPNANDRSIFTEWDLSECKVFDRLSGKAKRLAKGFLKKTLSADISYRYQSAGELTEALDELITECDPKRRHLNSTVITSPNHFVGRQNELSQITDTLSSNDCHCVFLHGIGGIGKTEIALRYANLAIGDYDTICFGRYSDSLKELFCDDSFISIENNGETEPGFKSLNGLVDSRTLLIIDNLDTFDDPDFNKLLGLNCKLLITSRCDFSSICPDAKHIDVHELTLEEQKKLFTLKLGNCDSGNSSDTVEDILRLVQGYTLLIPLIADVYKRGAFTIEEIDAKIKESGISSIPDDKVRIFKDTQLSESAFNILCNVLDMSAFSTEERYVMDSIALLTGVYYDRKQFLGWLGKEYNNALNSLTERGWLQSRGAGPSTTFTMHGIIFQTYMAQYKPSVADLHWFNKFCDDYINECDRIARDSRCCLNCRKNNDIKGHTPRELFDMQASQKLTLENGNPKFDLKFIEFPSVWDEFSFHPNESSPLWRTSFIVNERLKEKWKFISVIIKNVEPDEVLLEKIIEMLTNVCDYSVYRALNFTFNIQVVINYIFQSKAINGVSHQHLRMAYYLKFLLYLRDMLSRSIEMKKMYDVYPFIEIAPVPNEYSDDPTIYTKDMIQSAKEYMQMCSGDIVSSTYIKVILPCIEAGIYGGLYLFKTAGFYNYNEQLSGLFITFVSKLINEYAKLPEEDKTGKIDERQFSNFSVSMSLEKFNKQEKATERDYEIENYHLDDEPDHFEALFDKLPKRYEKANDSEKPKIYGHYLLVLCERYFDPLLYHDGWPVDFILENKDEFKKLFEDLDELDYNEAEPGYAPYYFYDITDEAEESYPVGEDSNRTVEYVNYAIERVKYKMIFSYIIGDYEKSKEQLVMYLELLRKMGETCSVTFWDDGHYLDELIQIISNFKQLGTSTEYKVLAGIVLNAMEDNRPEYNGDVFDYSTPQALNHYIFSKMIELASLAENDTKVEQITALGNNDTLELGFYI